MSLPRPPECVPGDEALERGAWAEARAAFEAARRIREIPEALEGLGKAAWWLDLADLVFDARERAYRLYLTSGDHAAAARIAVWLAMRWPRAPPPTKPSLLRLRADACRHESLCLHDGSETIIVLYGQGPVEFNYVNPADDPRNAKKGTM